LVVAAVSLIAALLLWRSGTRRHPELVTRSTVESLINVHGSPERRLSICGRTFSHLKGGPPYYIAVPTNPLVLFAYEPVKGARTLVVCNTNDCSFREIPLGEAAFGDQIGYWSATKGRMGDLVESVSSNRIALLSKGFRYLERSVLDLNNDTFRVVEVQSERNQISLDIWTNQQQPSANPK
jgi:hypothetical protein